MLLRLLAAASAALLLTASPAIAQSGATKAHIAAAKKAERAKNYKKMLAEYQAACAQEPSGECQLGIADAYAKLGDKEKARAAYNTLINDPFAQSKWISRARNGVARLDRMPDLPKVAAGEPALPSLDLPTPAGDAKKAAPPPSLDLPPLDLPPALAEAPKKGKKDKGNKVAQADAPPPTLDLPPLDMPAPPPPKAKGKTKKDTAVAKKDELPALPALDLPPTPTDTKVAKADVPPDLPALDLPMTPPAEPPKVAEHKAPELKDHKKDVKVAVATPPPSTPPREHVGVTAPPPKTVSHDALVAPVHTQTPAPAASSGKVRVLAFATAGVAALALGGGALAYTKAGSNSSDLHTGIRTAAQNQDLLGQQKMNKTLAAVGLLGGVVAGGVAAVLFTF